MSENRQSLYLFIFISCLGFLLILSNRTDSSLDITQNEIMGHIRYLSHESRSGRYPGTRGSKDVISYIIKQFKSYGIMPGSKGSFVQPFDITTGIELGEVNYAILNGDTLIAKQDYIPLAFSENSAMSGSLVFAGYGFKIEQEDLQWNDYKNLDVNGKWVVIMRHSPERHNQHSKYAPHSSLHKKMLVARDQGAAGVIFVSQIEDEDLYPLTYNRGYKNAGIPVIHLSNKAADNLFKPFGWSRQSIQETMNRSLTSINFKLNNMKFFVSVELSLKKTRAANVIGTIKSGNRKYRDEYIVVGAHFDHLGIGGAGSGSRDTETQSIHPGADDNASGVSGLLELAQKLSAQRSRLKRSVLFIGFDAEEKGLLGSKHFIKNPTVDIKKIITMVNMDMIGRMEDSSATVGGVGTSPVFKPLLDSLKDGRMFTLGMSNPGFGPSDHAAFYAEDIPVLFFFTGIHNDYHTPRDTWKNINLSGTKKLLDLVYDVAYHLLRTSSRPTFSEAGPKQRQMSNTTLKVTLGVMPSYVGTEIGLKIDAVSDPDGPAARAGIKKGDIIKAVNGKPIKDIYEYMERLGELRKGMTVPVLIERSKSEMTVSVTF
tara:strand:+ start:2204 stop:3997 length:1794 start_codon:yes stop_codon:yes gene_type:complete